MGGGSRPGYTARVKVVGLDETILTLQISKEDAEALAKYFAENGSDYMAQFSPAAAGRRAGYEES